MFWTKPNCSSYCWLNPPFPIKSPFTGRSTMLMKSQRVPVKSPCFNYKRHMFYHFFMEKTNLPFFMVNPCKSPILTPFFLRNFPIFPGKIHHFWGIPHPDDCSRDGWTASSTWRHCAFAPRARGLRRLRLRARRSLEGQGNRDGSEVCL